MKEKKYIVYRHTAPNGKMYIGVTSLRPNKRWRDGRGYEHNKYFSRAIDKYGWNNFRHEILLDSLTKGEASLAEKIFIGYWDLTNSNKGYNLAEGGLFSVSITEATRRKMSEAHIGEKNHNYGKSLSYSTRLKMSQSRRGSDNPMYGRSHKQSTKEKISKALEGGNNPMYGKTQSDEARANISAKNGRLVVAIDVNTNQIVNTYCSMRMAEKVTGIAHEHISACCRGKQKTAGGYRWEYA